MKRSDGLWRFACGDVFEMSCLMLFYQYLVYRIFLYAWDLRWSRTAINKIVAVSVIHPDRHHHCLLKTSHTNILTFSQNILLTDSNTGIIIARTKISHINILIFFSNKHSDIFPEYLISRHVNRLYHCPGKKYITQIFWYFPRIYY